MEIRPATSPANCAPTLTIALSSAQSGFVALGRAAASLAYVRERSMASS